MAPKSYVQRDPRVRAAFIKRAGGSCEKLGCGESRPCQGFLDVHHILGAEKGDRVLNCVALCPNCHREAHMAPGQKEINKDLLAIVDKFRARFKPIVPITASWRIVLHGFLIA